MSDETAPLTETEISDFERDFERGCVIQLATLRRLVAMARRQADECSDSWCRWSYERHMHHIDGSLYLRIEGPPIPEDQLPSIEEVAGKFDFTRAPEETS